MSKFKVGDLVNVNPNAPDYKVINYIEGPFPKRVTSIMDKFVRFKGRGAGWYSSSFVKAPDIGPKGEIGPVGADGVKGVAGPQGPEGLRIRGKYDREIIGLCGKRVVVDVYRVLDAFSTHNPILDHLIKKALCAGLRGHKDRGQDLRDILHSAHKAVELFEQKEDK